MFFPPQDIAFGPTLSQFAGLLSCSSWQDLGEHAFSLHARLTRCCATNTSRSGSRLGAWTGAKRAKGREHRTNEKRKRQTNKQPMPHLPKNLLELKQLLKIVSLIQHYDETLRSG